LCRNGKTRWVAIPPGDDIIHTNVPDALQTGPVIKYRQKEGEKTCLVYSFGSALYYVGARQLSSELYRCSKLIIEQHDTFKKFLSFLQTRSRHMNFKVLKVSKWNILENGDEDLVVAMIRGIDGKEDHCVTILGKLIFDSNFEKALPLCREALDLCCSSDTKKTSFDSVVAARLFFDYKYNIDQKY